MIQSLPVDKYASPTTITDGESSLEYYMKPVSLSIKKKNASKLMKDNGTFQLYEFRNLGPFYPLYENKNTSFTLLAHKLLIMMSILLKSSLKLNEE